MICVPTSVLTMKESVREKSRHSQQQESHSDIETVPEEESVRLLDVEQ